MNFVGELLGKFNNFFADNQETNETNVSETNETFFDDINSITDKTTASDQRGLSSMIEGLNSILATFRTSVSDQGRLIGLFGGFFGKTTRKSVGPLRSFSAPCMDESIKEFQESKDMETYIDMVDVSSRIKSESCGRKLLCWTKRSREHGCRLRKFRKGENTSNLKRSTAINILDKTEQNFGSKSSSCSTLDGSLVYEKGGQTCVIEEPSSNEEGEHESSSSSIKHNELSFLDIVRENVQSLERNIVLRHRRYNKCAKRQAQMEFYRNKYKTGASEPSKGIKSKEETATNGKSKGVSRLFELLRTKKYYPGTRRTDSVRKRVAIKLEKRKQIFEGQSRGEIVAHFREKYLNES